MASIGGITVLTMEGTPDPMGEVLKLIARAGVDGMAYSKMGTKPAPFGLFTRSGANSATAAKTLVETYKALQGTVVEVVDATGRTWSNVVVIDVVTIRIRAIVTGVGDAAGMTHILQTRWQMESTT